MIRRAVSRIGLVWLSMAAMAAAGGPTDAGAPREALPSYRTTRWTTDDGLPQNRVSCLLQTRDGYLWVGTWFGLARFDGVRFTPFDRSNTPEFTDDAINALAEDGDGTLWIGTARGLLSYRDHRFRREDSAEAPGDAKIWRLAASRSGGIWIQTGDTILRSRNGRPTRVWSSSGRRANPVRWLGEDRDGWLDVVTDDSWVSISPDDGRVRTNLVVAPADPRLASGAVAARPGRHWIGTRLGLLRFDGADASPVPLGLAGTHAVDFLHEDRSGNLWANLYPGGLHRLVGTRWIPVGLGDRQPASSTVCMAEDREGNLWAGTDEGLVRLRTRPVTTYTTGDGLAGEHVWSVCEGAPGTVWAGGDRGLNYIRDGRVSPPTATEPNPGYTDRCLWPASGGGVWIGKPGVGILRFRDRFEFVLDAGLLPDPNIFALRGDRSGRLWIGTGKGVAVLDGDRVTATYTNWSGVPVHSVRAILEDRAGDVWFGTQGQGLGRLRDGAFASYTARDGLGSDRVWAIHEDGDGTLWLGTEGGLARLRHGRFFVYTRRHGLPADAVNSILEDDSGSLWLGGLHGIYRIKRRQLDAVAEGGAAAVECASYGTFDGMESSETNGEGQPAAWKAADGRLWFPTTRGVVAIDPRSHADAEMPPPVVIEQVKADGEIAFGDHAPPGAPASSPVRFGPGRAQLVAVSYTANTFVDPRRARFRYRMVGRDSGWREETSDRVAHYTNLRPGKYRFEVTAANQQGIWNPRPTVFEFSIAPRFHETWPFYMICTVGGVGVAAGVQRYRLRWQRRLLELDQQRALASERARIARDLHDDLGTSLTGLALELDVIRRDARGFPPIADRLDASARRTRELASQMREVVWTVNPQCDTVSSLAGFLEQQAGQFLHAAGIATRLDFPEDIPPLPLGAEARHQLALSVREALSNVVRHAAATRVVLGLRIDGELVVQVADNGRGFVPTDASSHGLGNMRTRLREIGGSFECRSTPGAGTTVVFRIPLPDSNPRDGGAA